MSSLYKPKIVTYRLPNGSYRTPDGHRVTKDTPDAIRTVEVSKKWYGRYTCKGKTIREPLSESKETARRMLAKLAGDAQLASVGITDAFAEHRGRPLLEHLEDFRRDLLAKGDTEDHAQRSYQRVRLVAESCCFKTIDDIQASPVVEFLARLRDQAPERVELDPKKQEYKKSEMVAALGIHPASVARMLASPACRPWAMARGVAIRESWLRRFKTASAGASGHRPPTTT